MISASTNKFSYCLAQLFGGFLQIFLAVTKAQTLSIELLKQFCGVRHRHPYVWWGESSEFRGAFFSITKWEKDKFITFTVALMGDLTKNFSRYEVQCSCGCGASWVSPKLLEKLQHVRDVVDKPMTITSGVRCEAFNSSIKGSLVSSHMPNEDGMGLAVDIACTTSRARYEMVDVAIKFFRRIGIAGEHSGNFIHLDVDPNKTQDVIWTY